MKVTGVKLAVRLLNLSKSEETADSAQTLLTRKEQTAKKLPKFHFLRNRLTTQPATVATF